MTKEEALRILDWIPTKGEEVDALEMAIEALKNYDNAPKETLKEIMVIQCDHLIPPCELAMFRKHFTEQAKEGLILLPTDFHLEFIGEESKVIVSDRETALLDVLGTMNSMDKNGAYEMRASDWNDLKDYVQNLIAPSIVSRRVNEEKDCDIAFKIIKKEEG